MKRPFYVLAMLAMLATAGGCKMWEMFQKPSSSAVASRQQPEGTILPYGTRLTATARHVLVPTEAECSQLKSQIESGSDFAQVARLHSKCPSSQQGGDLGEFGRGQMAPEFDRVVFSEEIGKVHGPVKTSFGYHLIQITSREAK